MVCMVHYYVSMGSIKGKMGNGEDTIKLINSFAAPFIFRWFIMILYGALLYGKHGEYGLLVCMVHYYVSMGSISMCMVHYCNLIFTLAPRYYQIDKFICCPIYI